MRGKVKVCVCVGGGCFDAREEGPHCPALDVFLKSQWRVKTCEYNSLGIMLVENYLHPLDVVT